MEEKRYCDIDFPKDQKQSANKNVPAQCLSIKIINNKLFLCITGSNGPQKFCIEKVGKESWLPRSHTW